MMFGILILNLKTLQKRKKKKQSKRNRVCWRLTRSDSSKVESFRTLSLYLLLIDQHHHLV
ncbi:unnamed protein product [Brassica oleracea]